MHSAACDQAASTMRWYRGRRAGRLHPVNTVPLHRGWHDGRLVNAELPAFYRLKRAADKAPNNSSDAGSVVPETNSASKAAAPVAKPQPEGP